ncbi:hypothetical protein POL68_39160 [Stigmatella sp. ncwal1]|uniref:Intracellular proteinase inhibitor BsuPI domain-containing protein n=1 Tax=Stigmatella ashevillensis TaxID=2995309 RepID=A0ABT5DLP9_9BACT|nr:hypothetical protein [Stigmatella ashevillena]MDC0714533.1 hypothetical protein [Stigmatella ashevillena]
MKRRCTPAGIATIAVLIQGMGMSGCCPGPRAYGAGLHAFAKARVANRILVALHLERTLIAFPPAQDEGTRGADGSVSVIEASLEVEFPPGQGGQEGLRVAGLMIRDGEGWVVNRQSFGQERVSHGQTLRSRLELKGREGKPLPPGEYTVEALLFSEPEGEPTVVQAQFRLASCAFY